jgi:hypothetical protein
VARFADSVVQPTAETVGLSQTVLQTPQSVTSTIRVNATSAARADGTVNILVPSWTNDVLPPTVNGKPANVTVNGKAAKPIPGQFMAVRPPHATGWATGDTISVELPCPVRFLLEF